MNKSELISFEDKVRLAFESGLVKGPVHLSGGNEDQLIQIFQNIKREDWVCSTWRNHYHALLHGIPPDELFDAIMEGKSLSFNSVQHRFYTSAIVGGTLPIAVGVAAGIKRRGGSEKVWCFVGDMAASIGAFADAVHFSDGHALPIRFVIEDNEYSTGTPTCETWADEIAAFQSSRAHRYHYTRTVPHYGSGKVRDL